MDPNTSLAELRRRAARLIDELSNGDAPDEKSEYIYSEAYELAELVEALDQWLSRGGFLPEGWRQS